LCSSCVWMVRGNTSVPPSAENNTACGLPCHEQHCGWTLRLMHAGPSPAVYSHKGKAKTKLIGELVLLVHPTSWQEKGSSVLGTCAVSLLL
jgi:hypothetical protein